MNGAPAEGISLIQTRIMDGLNRSITVLLSTEINSYLLSFFPVYDMLVLLFALHALLSMSPSTMPGFDASWQVIKGLFQTLLIQLVVSIIIGGVSNSVALFNVLVVLMAAECIPAIGVAWGRSLWVGEDVNMLVTSISYLFSDEVSTLLISLGIPLGGAAVGLFFGGKGLFGQTLALTGVNILCSFAFGAISGGDLSLAWPLLLLYFVFEAARKWGNSDGTAFVDYGMYKASDAVYGGLMQRGVEPGVIVLVFVFLVFAVDGVRGRRGGDEVWTGVCVLVMVRGASDWFISSIGLISQCDPVIGGLVIVTVIHFVTVGAELFLNIDGKRRNIDGKT